MKFRFEPLLTPIFIGQLALLGAVIVYLGLSFIIAGSFRFGSAELFAVGAIAIMMLNGVAFILVPIACVICGFFGVCVALGDALQRKFNLDNLLVLGLGLLISAALVSVLVTPQT